MSFTTAGADNPFSSGTNLTSVSLDPTVDHSDQVPVSAPTLSGSLFESGGALSNAALSITTTVNSTTRDIELVSSGGSVRPTSGMVYPRRTD